MNRARTALLFACASAFACSEGAPTESEPSEDTEQGGEMRDARVVEEMRDARVRDATPPPRRDASVDARRPSTMSECALGEAGSFATDGMLDLFGQVTYFAKGQHLPAGRYRVTYADGCMKYSGFQPWKVHQNVGLGPDGWHLVGDSLSERIMLLPGVASDLFGGFQSFDECVSANHGVAPMEFDFAGGKLGIGLNDTPYDDNVAGEGGRNPKWTLSLLVEECPPDLVLL